MGVGPLGLVLCPWVWSASSDCGHAAGAGGEVTEDLKLWCSEPWEPSPQDGPRGMEITGGAPTCSPQRFMPTRASAQKRGSPPLPRKDTPGVTVVPSRVRGLCPPTPQSLRCAQGEACSLSPESNA